MPVAEMYERMSRISLPTNKYVTMAVLIMANLLNYMDRFTVAGVLTELQKYFKIGDSDSGLLQTVFIVFYMICAPICGFLGDRYNRKLIMSVGLSIWVLAVAGSTFVGHSHYWIFLSCRALVGVGEASYSTIAPTIITDMFTGRSRLTWLTVFYLMIPLGSGLGFAVGSNVSILIGHQWQWGVRVTPILGLICLLMIIFLMENPERGAAEHAKHEVTSLKEDLAYLARHKTFVCTTFGLTAVIFGTGALSWWMPTLVQHAYKMKYGTVTDGEKITIALTFGVITSVAGIAGVLLGPFFTELWKEGRACFQKSEKAGVFVCAFGSLGGLPFLYLTLMLVDKTTIVFWVTIFFAITFMCFNWAVNMNVLMTVIVANRRALANAIQTMVSHALGDAASPYVVGAISDGIRGNSSSDTDSYFALRDALFLPNFVLVFSIAGYLAASFFVEEDGHDVEEHVILVKDEEANAIMEDQDDQEAAYGAFDQNV
ncbi:hypothetical protein L596_023128 [Steinernema carpocapsae]|uniref:Major facilitator superfamily (MFS) profile domain-containing protein n=1 Tax=Steinernema carpocapsae TaxID=34508 RepID=A0A4U5MCS4_STECR|nr:hypothetical protein L596_023128 [Steinernema carpocapsae]